MSAKGYCTAAEVAAFLGVTFTAGQTTQAGVLIEQAESYIDGETNRAWLVGAQTDEVHYIDNSRFIFLQFAPVTSVQAITGRAALGASETTLTANVDYEVRDLAAGLIALVSGGYDQVKVDYTPVAAVPAEIKLACIQLVANWLQPQLQPGSYGLDSYSLPDLTVNFARSHVQNAAPPTVQQILERWRFRVYG